MLVVVPVAGAVFSVVHNHHVVGVECAFGDVGVGGVAGEQTRVGVLG